MEVQTVGHLPVGSALGPVLHVRHPLDGQRMRSHIDWGTVLIDPARLLQAAKEIGHAAHIEAGLAESLKTYAIGFTFEIAAVGQLCLNRPGLCRCNGRGCHLRVRSGGENSDGHRDHGGDRALLFAHDLSCQVCLQHVRDLVCQDGCQFGLRLSCQQCPRVHADETTEHGKGIDCVVADKKEVAVGSRVRTGSHQPATEVVEVIRQLGIVDVAWLAQTDLVQNPLADLAFELWRQFGTGGFAQVWQFVHRQGR
ncbi:MAG: hypothetical protein FAZ92_01886 [Accumulibacter sp.]|nr:MAG: hypothetical protein FAZ92_01886 [Accumulibacter sp.]